MIDLVSMILGISLAIIAAVGFNLAVVYQKKGLHEGPNIEFQDGMGGVFNSFKELFQNKTWFAGFLLGIISWFPYIIAIGLVSILVVSPLISVGLIVFVIAANKIIGEKVSLIELGAIAMLILAPIFITIAEISNTRINLVSFIPLMIVFMLFSIGLAILSFYVAKLKRDTSLEGLFLVFTGAILYSLGIIFTNIFTQALSDAQINPLFFWEFLFGIFWFDYYHLWAFLGFYGMIVFNVISIAFYQAGFQKGEKITILFPIFNILTIFLPVIAGLFIFAQSFSNNLFFTISLIMIFIATLILSKFQADIEKLDNLDENEKSESMK